MAKKDYYEILGLEKSASEDDIKKAYRKLAVQYHPDKNPGDKNAEEKFRQATEAYEILKDPDKRSKYDQFGHAAFDGAAGGGFGGFSTAGFDLSDALRAFMGDFGSDSIFNDIFGFGGSKRQSGNRSHGRRGNDLQIHLKLTLEEMYNGVQKKLKVRRKEACEPCKGSGSTSGNKANCTQCNGHGRVRHVANSMFGQVIQESICPSCQGEGKIVKDPCKSCSGGGRKTEETTVVVDIPAGVAEGNYLTVQGKGDAGLHGGQAGDLIVIIQEEKHDFFERHGIDVFCTIEISFSDAALGTAVTVPTLDGKVSLKIPPGTQSEKIFRLREKGYPALHHRGRGDQLVKVHVETPSKLSSEERKLFEQLASIEKKPKNFFEKTKEMFS